MSITDRLARWRPWGDVPEVTPAALHEMLDGPAPPVLIDVRSGPEFRRSRIAGARHVPITRLTRELPRLHLPEGRRVIAICLTAHRSIPAARLLAEHGHEAAQLAGGMRAWWKAGLPTDKG